MTAPAPVQPDPEAQQPPPDHSTAETVATIAGLLAAAGSVGATYGAAETARAGIVHALGRLGLRRADAQRLVAQDAATPPPPRIPVSAAVRRVGGDGPTYRALYLVNAAKRLSHAAKDPNATLGDQLAKERRWFNQHKTAQTEREQAAQRIDAATNSWGPILSWNAHLDDRVTPFCRAANGRNFRVDRPPKAGLPGLLHAGNCRCWPGPPIPGANRVDDLGPAHEHANTREGIELGWDSAAHPRAKAGSPQGGQFVPLGQARDQNAAQAQKVKGAVADYKATLTAKDAKTQAAQLKAMDDKRLEALSRVLYSYNTSDKTVVAARIAVANELARRGLDVKDYGALGGGLAKGAKKTPTKTAPTKSAGVYSTPLVHLAADTPAVELSAKTAYYSGHHHELGTPGGPGLWRHKGWQLPNYITNIAKGIMESGVTDKSRAIEIAVGKVRDWAEGKGKVSPEVRAASAKAIAQWEALRAKSHAHSRTTTGVELASANGHHIPGTPITYRHGWKTVGGGNDLATLKAQADRLGPHSKAAQQYQAALAQASPKKKNSALESFAKSLPSSKGKPNAGSGGKKPVAKATTVPPVKTKPATVSAEHKQSSLNGLSQQQLKALTLYTGDDFRGINGGLRAGKVPAKYRDTVSNIDSALAAKPLKEPTKVWRTVGGGAFGLSHGSDASALKGKTFTEAGFMSTSTLNQRFPVTPPPVHLTVEVPAGIGANYLEPITKNKTENELLLPRNLRYVITNVRYSSAKGGWTATARVLPPHNA